MGRGQRAGDHDVERGRQPVVAIGLDRPTTGTVVVGHSGHSRAEPDVAPQVEAIGDVADVAQDLRLSRIALGPAPALLQLFREGIGVMHTLDAVPGGEVAVSNTKGPSGDKRSDSVKNQRAISGC